MMIRDLVTADALPVLAASMRFAARRQPLIAHNIANASTPEFRPIDVSPRAFQAELARAVDARRETFGGVRGELEMRSTRDFAVSSDGRLSLRPSPVGEGLLFHDQNDRDLERLMQDQVENASAFRLAATLFRSQMDLLNSAISERV
ncbi:MAG: hypothetical protein D6693_02510 [Planctomycetota bacterium]|nr:MAG: hypothetical protein D6693_02510 [Planctomycetota bacterium]